MELLDVFFWFGLMLACKESSSNPESWPYISLGNEWDMLEDSYPFIVGILVSGFILINFLISLFVMCGLSAIVQQSGYDRDGSLTGGNYSSPARYNSSNSNSPQTYQKDLEFLDQMLNQQSTLGGKTEMLSKFLVVNLKKTKCHTSNKTILE
ncbi:MAG: hypothetical protein IPM91_19815 [Bacteroidetes bacterium]|nr:hypothetical protein [Bacteroidota bacterium]